MPIHRTVWLTKTTCIMVYTLSVLSLLYAFGVRSTEEVLTPVGLQQAG